VSIPWDTTTVADGSQTLTAAVKDATGNTGGTSQAINVKNATTTVPPLTLAFSSPAAGATVSGTVSVGLAATGGTGYTYTLAVDSAPASTVTTPFSWNTTTVANGSHTLTATVKDSTGRTTTATRTVTVSNVVVTPLTVAITAPTATTVSGTTTFTAAASGGSGYAYKLSIDGAQVATTASYSWNTTTATNATHTLTASVTDAAGRTATASKTVTVSNTVATSPPPSTGSLQLAVTQPTANATVSGTNWAIVWVTGATGARAFTLTAGGKTVGTGTASGTGPASIPWNTTLVADGSQTLTVSVRDATGKTGTMNVPVNVKNGVVSAPPPAPTPTGTLQVAITQPTGGSTVLGTAWVVAWVTGASGTANVFTLSVDGVTVGTTTVSVAGPVSIPWTTTSSTNGSHTVKVTVRDATGNTGSTSATVTVAN